MANARPCRNVNCPHGGQIELFRGRSARVCQECSNDRKKAGDKKAHEQFVQNLKLQGKTWNGYCADNKGSNPNYKYWQKMKARSRRKAAREETPKKI